MKKVYKYRGGPNSEDDKNGLLLFERDIQSLECNYFWAADNTSLNDPCECLVDTSDLDNQIELFGNFFPKKNQLAALKRVKKEAVNLFNVRKNHVGIFSLSKTFLDELLWAHYANSHQGFCIEYDLDLLVSESKVSKARTVDVLYNKHPPKFDTSNLSGGYEEAIKKIGGHKSLRWKYENEIRIITEFTGRIHHEPSAIKSIYFGLRMKKEYRNEIIKRLQGRSIKYYEVIQIPGTYQFKRNEIIDPNGYKYTYLKEIRIQKSKKSEIIKFEITKKDYSWDFTKATIHVKLENKIDANSLEKIADKIKLALCEKFEHAYIFYYLGNKKDFAWATSNLNKNGQIEINFNY